MEHFIATLPEECLYKIMSYTYNTQPPSLLCEIRKHSKCNLIEEFKQRAIYATTCIRTMSPVLGSSIFKNSIKFIYSTISVYLIEEVSFKKKCFIKNIYDEFHTNLSISNIDQQQIDSDFVIKLYSLIECFDFGHIKKILKVADQGIIREYIRVVDNYSYEVTEESLYDNPFYWMKYPENEMHYKGLIHSCYESYKKSRMGYGYR